MKKKAMADSGAGFGKGAALDVTLSQFFCEEDMKDMTETQTEVLEIWKDLSADEQEVVLAMLRGLKK